MKHIIGILLAVPVLLAGQGHAQAVPDRARPVTWRDEASTLGINALVGGVAAGIAASVRGGKFLDGFGRGAAGGGVAYAGKRIAAERWFGAGLVGRGVHGAGASMVGNAVEGRGVLSRVSAPLGPLTVHLGAADPLRARVTVDPWGIANLLAMSSRDGYRMDVEATISAGAPVFYTADRLTGMSPDGSQAAGVITIGVDQSEWNAGRSGITGLVGHERVHVLQHDFARIALGTPLQQRMLGASRLGRLVHRYVDVGLNLAVWEGLNQVIPYERRPWEREAYFLSRRAPGGEEEGGIGW
jgi:hypothetical protein